VKNKTLSTCAEEAARAELNLNMPEIFDSKGIDNSLDNKRFFIYAKKICPRRSLDALRLQKHLVENNWRPVSDPHKANFIFVYSCGCFNYYEKLSIFTIEKALENKSAKVIVTGCLPKINPESLDKYKTAYITSPEELKAVASIPDNFSYSELNDSSVAQDIHDLHHGSFLKRLTTKKIINFVRYSARRLHYWSQRQNYAQDVFFSKSTYRLEIAKGCLGDCSYCAIRIGMPKFKSRPEEQIVEEFRFGLKDNYKTFALMAGDIGCYGFDINTNLSSLLSKLFAVSGDYKILLWDLNVRWFVKHNLEMRSVLKTNFKKVERIIMPIESGSNRILKLMNRHYEIEEVKNCILNLQKSIPEIVLETHILVGFPGETDEDFSKSLDLIREIDFHDISIFTYEDRPGTATSNMLNKVPEEVIKRRKKILREEFKCKNKRAHY
jgi:tRNA A37 methylthiotransferase MiaB